MPFGTVTLNDGNEFPTIAFGTGSTMKFKDVSDYVGQAIENGFSHIDTAQFYQTETYVGLAIKESGLPRSSLYITTKYSGPGKSQQAIHQSLNKIGISYVDLYLVHFPALFSESVWQELEKMKKDGLTRSIGVSNFTLEDLQKLLKTAVTKPAVNQIRFHPYNYASHKALLEYCSKRNIIVEAYGSLNSITQNPGGPVDAVVNAAAKRIGATPNQVIFSWVRSKGVSIVTTTRSKERLQEYLAVEDLPPLTAEEIAAIDDAGAKGPPSQLVVARLAMQHRFEKSSSLVMWLAIAIVLGFATFFML
ncbi:NADP-dependent oxidoreductase domain-containing protein [Suillus fuscotomentosus]|uniref:NADP-dependent oxidoreductase domain-containing protein n=1 Tax=Suillus fuscotomentosus TaxID=1912939 RepID=A0AAD4HQI4_9AGAM|nr:NADP-dependent oxidoreductase domain-containing protein [Suillus fuscotomentosus]KAG1906390.1 NADP-dependent oxidoreductase domain-containing protein [Suillus fuscotomentosus]